MFSKTQNSTDAALGANQMKTVLEDSGFIIVPLIPNEDQWGGLARDIMSWLDQDCRHTAGSLFQHLDNIGTVVPQWLRDEPEMKNLDHVPSKGTRVSIIYRAMLESYRS